MTLLRMNKLASSPGKVGYLPICRAQIYKLIKSGEFPPGVLLSARVRAWPLDEIDAWLSTRGVKA